MAPTLVSQVLRSSLRPLRDALGRQEHSYTQEEARDILDASILAAMLLDKLYEANGRIVEHGLEGSKLAFLLKESLDGLEECLGTLARAREVLATTAPFEGKKEGLALLENASQRAEKVREEYTSLLRWLDTPPPRLNPASLAGGGDSPTTEGYESIEDILARLQAGRDV